MAQSSIIEIPLKAVNHYLPKSYSQVGTGQSTDFTAFRGIPNFLVEKAIRFTNTVQWQSAFEDYKNGQLTEEEWQNVKRSCVCDVASFSPTPLRQRINALVGTDKQGRRVVIVDANNNQNFADDRILYYPMTQPTIERNDDGLYSKDIQEAVYDTLPAVTVQVEAFDGQKLIPRSVWVKPNPYNDGWTYKDSLENRYHLTFLASEHRTGNATIGGQPVYFVVTSGIPGSPYNTASAIIRILQDENEVSTVRGRSVHRIGQTVVVHNHRIEIKTVSLQGDKLFIVDTGLAK